MSLRPDLTVAAVIERDGQFLLVEERVGNAMVFNQPAGHVERSEELVAAVIRETLEETAWTFKPDALTGIYLWDQPEKQKSFLRFTFWGGARSRGSREGGGGAQAVIFIVAIILAVLAPLISRFIQLAVSRQREYLADASSVELTRNPYGLERALAKISADQEVLEVANRGTQHLYFTNPIKKFEERSSSLMSTHPAIIDRINRLRQLTGEPPLGTAEAAQLAGLD